MKNYYKIAILGLGVISSLTSCNKFLDSTPISSLTTDNAFSTKSDIESALTGAYNAFMSTNYYQWEIYAHTDIRSDNAYCGGSNDVDYYQLDMNTIPNTNGSVYRAWTELYASIAKANIVLNKIGSIKDATLTDERRQQIIGEALFLRAFHYYQLVSLWGGVPIERYSNSSDTAAINHPRATEVATYNFIDSCLEVAAAYLPATYGADNIDKVRATKGAAYAMLAKSWAQRSDRDYSKVSLYCDSVASEGYSLLSDFDNLFDAAHNYNAESIMEVPYMANTTNVLNWGNEMIYPTHADGLVPSDTWQRYCVPSRTLVAAYDSANDVVRRKSSVSFEEAPWADIYWNPCGSSSVTIPFPYKSRYPASWAGGDHNYLLRYADILLLKAEALANLGNTSSALTYLNLVHERAGLTAITSVTSTASLLKIILSERQLELAFEWQRWNDLKRFGVAVSTMNNLSEYYYTCTDDDEGTMAKGSKLSYNMTLNKTLLPIPLTEIQANPKLTQNTGY